MFLFSTFIFYWNFGSRIGLHIRTFHVLIMAYNAIDSDNIGSTGLLNVSSPSTSGMGSSSRTLSGSDIIVQQAQQPPVLQGNSSLLGCVLLIFCGGHCSDDDCFAAVPDFAEVYNFIGSVFDLDKRGHVEKLKEMDPVNFETVSQRA